MIAAGAIIPFTLAIGGVVGLVWNGELRALAERVTASIVGADCQWASRDEIVNILAGWHRAAMEIIAAARFITIPARLVKGSHSAREAVAALLIYSDALALVQGIAALGRGVLPRPVRHTATSARLDRSPLAVVLANPEPFFS